MISTIEIVKNYISEVKWTSKSKRRGIELNPLNDDPDRIEEEIAEEQQEALALASASMGIGDTATGNEAENGEE